MFTRGLIQLRLMGERYVELRTNLDWTREHTKRVLKTKDKSSPCLIQITRHFQMTTKEVVLLLVKSQNPPLVDCQNKEKGDLALNKRLALAFARKDDDKAAI